jgi:hypothetical protein
VGVSSKGKHMMIRSMKGKESKKSSRRSKKRSRKSIKKDIALMIAHRMIE